MFNQWMNGNISPDEFSWYSARMPFYRRELIARTETIKASNAITDAIYNEWGVPKKEWIATMDDRVRDTHAQANGQVVSTNRPFEVGGEQLMYPGDPSGSPENILNCRCTEVPVLEL